MDTIKVSIIGSTGYVGAELVHGFLCHPDVKLVHLTSQSFAGQLFSDVYPVYRGICDMPLEDITPEEELNKVSCRTDDETPFQIAEKIVASYKKNTLTHVYLLSRDLKLKKTQDFFFLCLYL